MIETVTIEEFAPDQAQHILNKFNAINRPLRQGHVERMAKDMREGRWTFNPEPITFDEDGNLLDGQHRLWAIVESGTTQRFVVARNVSREAALNINTGLSRKFQDNARIAGKGDYSTALAACARGIEYGKKVKHQSFAETLVVIEKHKTPALFALNHGPKTNASHMRTSFVAAAIGRAWYHEPDKERLAHFGTVAEQGYSDSSEDRAAISIRLHLTDNVGYAQNDWCTGFMKVQYALHQFMRRIPLDSMKGTSRLNRERYPLPK